MVCSLENAESAVLSTLTGIEHGALAVEPIHGKSHHELSQELPSTELLQTRVIAVYHVFQARYWHKAYKCLPIISHLSNVSHPARVGRLTVLMRSSSISNIHARTGGNPLSDASGLTRFEGLIRNVYWTLVRRHRNKLYCNLLSVRLESIINSTL